MTRGCEWAGSGGPGGAGFVEKGSVRCWAGGNKDGFDDDGLLAISLRPGHAARARAPAVFDAWTRGANSEKMPALQSHANLSRVVTWTKVSTS